MLIIETILLPEKLAEKITCKQNNINFEHFSILCYKTANMIKHTISEDMEIKNIKTMSIFMMVQAFKLSQVWPK